MQDKWNKSFSLWGLRELITHFPGPQTKNGTIRYTTLNSNYSECSSLAQKLMKETYHLICKTGKTSNKPRQTKMLYLSRILETIVADGDANGVNIQHKILYLTFKFITLLVSRQSGKNQAVQQESISIIEWLNDVHALFYKKDEDGQQTLHQNLRQELINILKERNEEMLILVLKREYAHEENPDIKNKIQCLLALAYARLSGQVNGDKRVYRQSLIKEAALQFKQIFQTHFPQNKGKSKHKNDKENIYRFVGEVLLGNLECIEQISSDSWPLYLKHYIQTQGGITTISYRQTAENYLKKRGKNRTSGEPQQIQYLLILMDGRNFHEIFEMLFDLISPIFAYLLGFYFCFFNLSSRASELIDPQYEDNILRNMIHHSCQVNFQTLLLAASILRQVNPALEGHVTESLLHYHVSVEMFEGENEKRLFFWQMELLQKCQFKEMAAHFAGTLFNKYLLYPRLSMDVIDLYLFLMHLSPQIQIEEELNVFFYNCFVSGKFDFAFTDSLQVLHSNNRSNWAKNNPELRKIKEWLERFQRLHQIYQLEDVNEQMKLMCGLLRDLPACLEVLKALKYVLDLVNLQHKEMVDESLKASFSQAIYSFLDGCELETAAELQAQSAISMIIY